MRTVGNIHGSKLRKSREVPGGAGLGSKKLPLFSAPSSPAGPYGCGLREAVHAPSLTLADHPPTLPICPHSQDPRKGTELNVTTDTLRNFQGPTLSDQMAPPMYRGHTSRTYQLRVDQMEKLIAVGGGWLFYPGAADENRWRQDEQDPWREDSASTVSRTRLRLQPPVSPPGAVCWAPGPHRTLNVLPKT